MKNVLSTSTSSNNGEKWSRSTTIDLEKSYFHAVINVDACRSDKAENILSVGGRECSAPSSSSNYMSIYPGFHIYYSKPSKNDWHHSTGTFTNALWFDIIPNATSEDGIYKIYGDITGDVTIDVKSDGVYVNGTKAIPSSALSGLFTTGSKTLYYSNREGTTSSDQASNAIYKEISVVTEQNFVVGEATTETELFSQTSSNNGEKWAKTTTIDFANQYFHVEMNLDECTKSSGNYNLLSVGNRAFSSTYYSIYPGYHIYYAKTKDNHSNVLWFDRIRTSGAGDGFHIYVDNITGDVTIDVKGDGIYVNGVKKVEVSDLSAFFATGSHTLYYSNQEGTNQQSYATYKKISVFTTGTVVDNYLRDGENNDSQIEEKPSNVKVALERTLLSDGWNTFCVPFTISNEAVKAAFGSDVQLRKFSGVEGNTMNFTACNDEGIMAGEPYLIKPTADVENPIFDGVSITAVNPTKEGSNGYYMVGTYGTTTLSTQGDNLFLGADNKFFKPSATGNVMKGMRAYFEVPLNSADPSALVARIDGELTSVNAIDGGEASVKDSRVFNLNGQCVGNSLNGLARGIYIQNGKKYVVR